jgi:hypothetical protein
MKTINQKLAITTEQYESIIWDLYNKWCQSVSITPREYQQVLANSAINAWFLMELAKCEKEFHTLTDRYTNTNVTSADYATCYRDCVNTLFNYRPMALLSTILKSKAKGVQVFNALNVN